MGVLHLGACVLLWRVGRRLFDERDGIVAGWALWIIHIPDRPVLPETVICRVTECPAGAGS